jgi:hypothetical protein
MHLASRLAHDTVCNHLQLHWTAWRISAKTHRSLIECIQLLQKVFELRDPLFDLDDLPFEPGTVRTFHRCAQVTSHAPYDANVPPST